MCEVGCCLFSQLQVQRVAAVGRRVAGSPSSAWAIARARSAKRPTERGMNSCTAVSVRELLLTRRGVVVAVPWAFPQQTGWWAKMQGGIGHRPRAASGRLKADLPHVNAIQQEDRLSPFQSALDAQGNPDERVCTSYDAAKPFVLSTIHASRSPDRLVREHATRTFETCSLTAVIKLNADLLPSRSREQ